MINNKILLLLIIFIFIVLNSTFLVKAQDQRFGETETIFKLKKGFIEIYLQTHQIFQNQTFWTKAIITTNESYADTFNAKIELPSELTLLNGSYQYSNPPINATTNFQWAITWFINSSVAAPGIYVINVTEDLFSTMASDNVTVNLGPTPPYNVTVETDKPSYSPNETGFVYVYIFDNNSYPFNLDGNCSSTIYYPNGSLTSFSDVFMVYETGSVGKYTNNFLVWGTLGTYTVEANCTNPTGGYASNTFEVSAVTTTTTVATTTVGVETTAPVTTAPPIVRISDFMVDKDLIQVLLTPGKTERESVRVINTGDTPLNITVTQQNLEPFLYFTGGETEYTFELDSGKIKTIELNFLASDDQEPGVFPGRIIFTGDSIERTVVAIVEVESIKPLFDVKVEVLPEYRIVYPGGNVMAQLTIYNLGRVGRVDSELEYGIKSLDGTVITSEHEIVAVETQLSTVKSMDLPSDIKPDSYVFYSKVTYNGIVGTGTSMFTVVERFKLSLYLLIAIIILAIIIILIILFIYYSRKRKRRKKKKKIHKKK